MDKVILVDKPKEWTSFDVVAKIRGIVRNAQPRSGEIDGAPLIKPPKIKVGHAGTLDPLATGLLVVLIGKATKKQDDYMKQDKVYNVELRLGQTSTTADDEGEKTNVPGRQPSFDEIKASLLKFVGNIQQTPPAFSAIKVDGQRAYKLARAGKDVKLKKRNVTIYSIEQIQYEYPALSFVAKVSSGTYIRSLATDIGEDLGTGAYMSNLRRTHIGNFSIDNAINIDQLSNIPL
jgi:tRNA pseudouridine55 synthase